MALQITDLEFKLLRDLIEKECGIFLTDNKAYLVETRLSGLVKECGCTTFGEFYMRLKSSPEGNRLCAQMIDAITTNETSWFRDQYPYRSLKDKLLPQLQKQIDERRKKQINIWSAGCSTGQEPYSISLTVLDFYNALGNDSVCHNWIRVLATDISSNSLSTAMEGRYDSMSIGRGLHQKYLDTYFHKDGKNWMVDSRVKKMITFKQMNLKGTLMGIGPFDIIFLRNVMIYFSETLKRDIFSRIARLLTPNGYLFLGTGETITGYSTDFDIVEFEGALFYRLKSPRNI